jgi:hypothetical protein
MSRLVNIAVSLVAMAAVLAASAAIVLIFAELLSGGFPLF